jgi:hypothetical protein
VRLLAWTGLVVGACQPSATPAGARSCPEQPLAAGEVWAGQLVCRDQRFTDGDGRPEDYWLANSRLRAVVRHPQASLTLAGVGGGTIVDAAPWGRADAVLEVAPLVAGGWLSVDDLRVSADAITLAGVVTALPDRAPGPADGERREVTWRVGPDEPFLRLEGADGLWVHPSEALDLLDGWLFGARVALGTDGVLEEDLGGAVRYAGVTRVWITEPAEALAASPGPHQALSGFAEGAATVRLFRGDAWVGTLPVADDGAFGATIPTDIDGVQAHGAGRPPSPVRAPGEGLSLRLGAPATLDLAIGWEAARPRPVRLRWSAADGRSGVDALDPLGESLALGAGVYTLELSAGPWVTPRTLRVELAPDSAARLGTRLVGAFDPDPYVYAALSWPAARSRTVRAIDQERLRDAVLRGLSFVVATAEDDVGAAVPYVSDAAWIRAETGARLTHPDGWDLVAWPWRAASRRSASGVPSLARLAPLDSLALAWGGAGTDRTLTADLELLQTLDAPSWSVFPRPELVGLPAPGFPPFSRWRTWFDWLDAGRFLLPSGPRHWLDVEEPDRYGAVDLLRAVHRGRFATGTGAWLDLRVDEAGPGEVLPGPPPTDDTGLATRGPVEHAVRLRVQGGAFAIRHLALVTTGGVLAATWETPDGALEVVETVPLDGWVVAVAWGRRRHELGRHRADLDPSPRGRARSGHRRQRPLRHDRQRPVSYEASMRALLTALALALPLSASAELSRPTAGWWLHVGGGLGAGDRPFRPGVGWHAGVGGWFGRYDDACAIGRHVGLGLEVRQDVQLHPGARELRTAPMLEVRRGIDLLVVGVRVSVLGGPLITTPFGAPSRVDGGTVRVAGAVHYRFVPRVSAYVRLEAGVDVVDVVQPALGVLLGVELAAPGRRRDPPPADASP